MTGPDPRWHLMWVRWYRFQWRLHAGHRPSTLSHAAGRAPSCARSIASAPFLRTELPGMVAPAGLGISASHTPETEGCESRPLPGCWGAAPSA